MRRSRVRRMAPALAAPVALATLLAMSGTAGAATRTPAPTPSGSSLLAGETVHSPAHQLPSNLRTDNTFPKSGPVTVMLELDAAPAAATYSDAVEAGASTASADSASQAQTKKVESIAATVKNHLSDPATKGRALFATHAAYAGVAVSTDASRISALSKIPGVAAVHPMPVKKIDNSVTDSLMRAPQAWQYAGETGSAGQAGVTGTGVTVGIIDTGIDYTHADFGGAGTVAAYRAALASDTGPWSPTAKVVGGYDFAGDDYNADPNPVAPEQPYQPVPHPDSNPLDCESHGTHVAGTAAGYGENADGSTYTGSYNTRTPLSSMKLGPGVAPQASLYALKIFGCSGSTNLVSEALDWALDPNGDGNISDHLDVVNMSLGSDYGSPQDPDSVAADNAARAGIVVVAAAGNGGDLYDVGGSPGNAARVIDVAASDDSTDWLDALRVNSPAPVAGLKPVEYSINYDYAGKPDVTGDLYKLADPANPDGCSPYSAADAAAVKGKVAWVEWTDTDSLRACGSTARANNAAAAGAIGLVAHDDEDRFSAGISGNALIPMVLMTKAAGDQIEATGVNGTNVTFSHSLFLALKASNSAWNDQVASFTSRGITEGAIGKPDLAAPGNTILSAGMGTGNAGLSDSGTSMATPHAAGLAALVVEAHPKWDTEKIKAAMMNTATKDVYAGPGQTGTVEAPERVGAGRVVADAAASQQVIAYNSTDHGSVGVSFGAIAVVDHASAKKSITLENTSNHWVFYGVQYSPATTIPGVTISLDRSQISVAPHSSEQVQVRLTATASAMAHTADPAIDTTVDVGVVLARQYLSEASGRVVFTPNHATAGSALRVPVYSAPRPASAMSQTAQYNTITKLSDGRYTGDIKLTGKGVSSGSGSEVEQSLVSGYELQGTSPKLPECSDTVVTGCVPFPDDRAGDLRQVGVSSDGVATYFAVNAWGTWRTPASYVEFDILIDTNNDGTPDYDLFNTRLSGSDVFVTELYNFATGTVDDIEMLNIADGSFDTDIFNSDTMVLPVSIAALGLSPGNSRFSYQVVSQTVYGTFDSIDTPMSFDPLNPGLQLTQSGENDVLYADQPGSVLTVVADLKSLLADHVDTLMLVHDFNADGSRTQNVGLLPCIEPGQGYPGNRACSRG